MPDYDYSGRHCREWNTYTVAQWWLLCMSEWRPEPLLLSRHFWPSLISGSFYLSLASIENRYKITWSLAMFPMPMLVVRTHGWIWECSSILNPIVWEVATITIWCGPWWCRFPCSSFFVLLLAFHSLQLGEVVASTVYSWTLLLLQCKL